ncbi:MAG: hypothetical protein ACLFUQ_04560 [Candidatus Izemoplasmataceae bacterium]
MKVKLFYAMSESKLEEKANDFLEDTSIEVVDIRYSATVFHFSLLILYK